MTDKEIIKPYCPKNGGRHMTVSQIRERLETHLNKLYSEMVLIPSTELKYVKLSYELQDAIKLTYRLGFEIYLMGDRYIVLG